MIIRLDRFFFDEKDIATLLYGIFLLAAYIFYIPVEPFRFESLIVVFLFLLLTRSLKNSISYQGYVFITLMGLFFSFFLSPYGVGIFLIIATLFYTKWGRV